LNITEREIPALKQDDLQGLTGLEVVQFAGSIIGTLPNRMFSGLENLREVSFYQNDMQEIPEGLFEGAPYIQEIYLAQCKRCVGFKGSI